MSKRNKISRSTRAKINYRGKDRNVIVEIDREKGLVALRLKGCKTRRIYAVADLYQPASPQLSFNL